MPNLRRVPPYLNWECVLTGTPPPPTAADRLRALWAGAGIVRVAGAHDVLGARIAVEAGMDAVWSSGLEISTSRGVPDASILTMTDYLAVAQSIAQGIGPVPVIADCDTGFGNSNNVIWMVQQFEAAGVAAVCIEDKKFPKTNSFIPGKQELASVPEFVGKILAAKAAQRTRSFAVIARTEALIAGWGVDEAIRRAEAYVRAGADALLIHDKSPTAAGIREFLSRWKSPVPVVVVPTTFPSLTTAEAEALGIKVVIHANQGIRASVRALTETWEQIVREGASAGVEDRIAPLDRLFSLQGMPAHAAAERTFDRAGMLPTRAIVLHAGAHRDDTTLATLTAEVPLPALDLNGTPLVQRQISVLERCGIRDITVVAGYRHDAVPTNGTRKVVNRSWETGGEVGSLLQAPAEGESADVRTLVCYGDVVAEPNLLERLLATNEACTVVVDRSPSARHDVRDRVVVDAEDAAAPAGRRFLSPPVARRVRAIGAVTPASEANGEFAGLLLVSGERWRALRARAERKGGGSIPDLLAEMIAAGEELHCLEVASGWLEVRSFADYERACRMMLA